MKKITTLFSPILLTFIVTLIFILISSIFVVNDVKAENEVSSDFDITYTVNESGITTVNSKIILTNMMSSLYVNSYELVLDNINPQNIKAYDEKGDLQTTKTMDGKESRIVVHFDTPVVGKNKSRVFWVVYEESSFAIRTGEVWEISIPRLADDANFSSYYVNLEIPESLGLEAYISPNPRDFFKSNGYLNYRFNKEDVVKSGITAGFGQFQVFSFTLNYHLENPLAKESVTEITLPPDTAFQRMYYSSLSPRPSSMYVDSDGNWIAKYQLKPRERVSIVATGHVQIFASQRPYPKPSQDSLNENLTEQTYWELSDGNIQEVAKNLKSAKDIYDFVSQKLKYDYQRVTPNVKRLGAANALSNPESAICMEFTDLFIALARARGIPAREINGFAYTENPEIQPLSLVNDVLHSWPEYYDQEKGAWIPIDPTWGSTTSGIDYFNKLDLRHFSFVIHGKSSTKPYPAGSYNLGANPQKDVFVSFGNLPAVKNSNIKVEAKLDGWLPLISNRLGITINNSGPTALYNVRPKIYFDDYETNSDLSLDVLLPFQTVNTHIDIPFSFLGANTPEIVKIIVNGESVLVATDKKHVVIYNLLFVFLFMTVIITIIMFKLKKWKFPKINS